MYYLLLLSVAFSSLAWLKGRPKGEILPSDAFFLFYIILMGVAPIMNPTAFSPLADNLVFDQATANKGMLGICISLWVFSIAWMVRQPLSSRKIYNRIAEKLPRKGSRNTDALLLYSFILLTLILALQFVSSEYLSFKFQVLKFFTGNLSNAEYAYARRIDFSQSNFLSEFSGRIRYSLIPPLMILSSIFLLRKYGLLVAAISYSFLFVIGPASLSKLPVLVFTAYFLLSTFIYYGVTFPLRAKFVLVSLSSVLILAIVSLAGIYFLQYSHVFKDASDFPDAVSLSTYRVLSVTYSGYLAHMVVYPDFLNFTGFSSIGLVGDLTGSVRIIDLEVARHFVGTRQSNFTSFPTGFIGGAYASFGYAGIVIFSVIVSGYLVFIDKLSASFRNPVVSIVYISTLMVNAVFFTILQAPPVFLSYGLIIIPVFCLVIDRVFGDSSKRRMPNQMGQPALRNQRSGRPLNYKR